MKKNHFLLTIIEVFLKNQIIDEHINQFESLLTKAAAATSYKPRTEIGGDSLKYDMMTRTYNSPILTQIMIFLD